MGMIFPIVLYGNNILRQYSQKVKDNEDVSTLISDMYETMANADGCGLAAPQINKSIQLVVIDTSGYENPYKSDNHLVIINPIISIPKDNSMVKLEEGCLSIPNIYYDVLRHDVINIKYYDENWQFHDETHSGMISRMIQHETDHLWGKLFIDYIPNYKIKQELKDIKNGYVDVKYKVI